MKILYIDQTGQLGGGEIAILPWLQAAKYDQKVVLFEDGPFGKILEESGVSVEILALDKLKAVRRESGLSSLLAAIPAFASLRSRLAALAKGFDVLYANSQKSFLLAALAKRRGQPLVWHLRDILTEEHFSAPVRKLAVMAGNRFATVIIANSQATIEAFVAEGGKREKIHLVYDGVSSAPFDNADPAQVAALRQEIGVPTAPLVGIFGRLTSWKGQHIFLEAMSGIPQAHGVLVGGPLFGQEVYAESLKARARQPDLAGRIHFLGFRHEVPPLMKAVDVIVHASISPEPFGLVIVEGMLAVKPVIASAAGGAKEIIIDGESGIMVEPGSVPALRQAILSTLSDPAYASRLASAGRKRAETEFGLNNLFKHLSTVLEHLRSSFCRKTV